MCNACGKPNHFQVVCRSKRSTKGSGRHAQLRVVDEEEHSSEDDVYFFAVRSNYKEEKPIIQVKVNSTPLALLADSRDTINVLDETDYRKLADPLKLKSTNIKTYAYQSDKPLHVLGKFSATIESKSKRVEDTLYVVKGSGGSLLSWKMSRDLNLLQTVQQINEVPRPKPAQLVAEYDELFNGLGKLRNYQVKLHVDQTVPPVAQPHRRIPFHVREHLKEQLKRDEELGVIERIEGPTPWVSPIVVVPKPKSPGKVRVCVDMRPANRAIRRERHASSTMKEIIRDLKGAKVFNKLDLNQCCNQLELAPESSYITTFSTHLGLMRYTRLNFGVCSAAEIFQNVIRETLEGINGAINISDDILVFGKSQEKHEQNLRCVFQRLKENGLTLNRTNCEFSKGRFEFFGYVFSEDGISPDPKKVEDIVNLQAPTNASEVRSLLGMVNYCARFIPDYATKMEPLRRLTHKGQPWNWTYEQERALAQLKDALASSPVTAYFDPAKEAEISVDASPVGLAAILSQVNTQTGESHVITYASRSLTETEQRYSQTEREALAVVRACEYLHLYIYGKPVTVHTDHKPLVSIYGNPNSKPTARIERWALRLQPY